MQCAYLLSMCRLLLCLALVFTNLSLSDSEVTECMETCVNQEKNYVCEYTITSAKPHYLQETSFLGEGLKCIWGGEGRAEGI